MPHEKFWDAYDAMQLTRKSDSISPSDALGRLLDTRKGLRYLLFLLVDGIRAFPPSELVRLRGLILTSVNEQPRQLWRWLDSLSSASRVDGDENTMLLGQSSYLSTIAQNAIAHLAETQSHDNGDGISGQNLYLGWRAPSRRSGQQKIRTERLLDVAGNLHWELITREKFQSVREKAFMYCREHDFAKDAAFASFLEQREREMTGCSEYQTATSFASQFNGNGEFLTDRWANWSTKRWYGVIPEFLNSMSKESWASAPLCKLFVADSMQLSSLQQKLACELGYYFARGNHAQPSSRNNNPGMTLPRPNGQCAECPFRDPTLKPHMHLFWQENAFRKATLGECGH